MPFSAYAGHASGGPTIARGQTDFSLSDGVRSRNVPICGALPRGKEMTMQWRLGLDDVLLDLCARGIQCGVATMPGGSMRAWIEVDGVLIEGHFEASPTASDQIASWLKETADGLHGPLSHFVDGVLPDNVVDARFLGGRRTPPTKEVFTP